MRRSVVAATAVALLVVPAHAQRGPRSDTRSAAPPQKTENQKRSEQKIDNDYKAALDRIPDKKFDPWGSVRPAAKEK